MCPPLALEPRLGAPRSRFDQLLCIASVPIVPSPHMPIGPGRFCFEDPGVCYKLRLCLERLLPRNYNNGPFPMVCVVARDRSPLPLTSVYRMLRLLSLCGML